MSNKKRSCLDWLKRCFIADETDVGNEHIQNDVIVINNNRHENNQDDLNHKIQFIEEKFVIQTKIEKNIILSNEAYEENTKHNCPICLKYYSNILKLECCNNFICIYCAEDYKTTQIKYEFHIKCPICSYDKVVKLIDADKDDTSKFYSDSPIMKHIVKVDVKSSNTDIINLQQV